MSGPSSLLADGKAKRQNDKGALAFRIHGTCYDGQKIRIAHETCSIGSGAGCTVRLRSHDIDPLHCLIIKGAGGVAVRNWSPKTRLNDKPFGDAKMTEGDRLAIGPVQLELIGEGAFDVPEPLAPNHASPRSENSSLKRLDSLIKDDVIKDVRTTGRRRVKGVIRALRSTRNELQDMHLQLDESAATERKLFHQVEQLNRQLSEREVEATEAKTALHTVEHEAETLRQQLDELNKEVEAKSSQFEQQDDGPEKSEEASTKTEVLQQDLGQLEQLKRQLSEEEERTKEAQADLDAAKNEVDTLRREKADLKDEFNLKSSEFEEREAGWQTERDQLTSQLDSARNEFGKVEQQLFESQSAAESISQAQASADTWSEEREEFQNLIEEAREQLEETTKELSIARDESQQLRHQLAAIEQEQGQYFSRNTTRESDMRKTVALLDERAQQIDEASTRLNQDRDAFELEQRQWESDRQRLEESIEHRQVELDEFEAALEQAKQIQDASNEFTGETNSTTSIESIAAQTDFGQHHIQPNEQPTLPESNDEPTAPSEATLPQLDSAFPEPVDSFPEPVDSFQEPDEEHHEGLDQTMRLTPEFLGRNSQENQADASYAPTTQEDLKFEATADVAPESTEDLFARAGHMPVSEENQSPGVTGPFDQPSDPVMNSDQDSTIDSPNAVDESGDDSIEAYMSSLLQRVRGENEEPLPSQPSNEQPTAVADDHQNAEEPAEETMKPSQFIPRRQAPEGNSHLAEMRKLANESARAAIKSSDKRRGVSVAKDRLLVSGVAAVIGVGLLAVTRSIFSPALYGAACCFIIAGWWGFEGFRVRKNLSARDELRKKN